MKKTSKPTFKCKICDEKFVTLEGLYTHIEEEHEDLIPKDTSVQEYYYFMKTGKTNGTCIICKKPTTWNTGNNKYNRFCTNPRCKDAYREQFRERMIGKYGRTHLLNDPEQQKKMLANRSISGEYTWAGNPNIKTPYTGSYEEDFLKTVDIFFDWDAEDIIMPSPHVYYYEYEGDTKFYIPDVFIPSLDLEIEIKDGGDNPNNHYKIQAVDKVKEKKKDEVLTSQNAFHYMKLINKNYANLIRFLSDIKMEFEKYGDMKKIPRKFYIEDVKTSNSTKVSLLKESAIEPDIVILSNIPDEEEDEALMENLVSFSLIKKVVTNHSAMTDGVNAWTKDFEKIQNTYIHMVRDAKSRAELEFIKKDINKVKKFLKDILNTKHQPSVDKTIVVAMLKWMNNELKMYIDIKESKITRRDKFNFLGTSIEEDEIIIGVIYQNTRANTVFNMSDTFTTININGTYNICREDARKLRINDSGEFTTDTNDTRQCMYYAVKSNADVDKAFRVLKQSTPKNILSIFRKDTERNEEFIASVYHTFFDEKIKPDKIRFLYMGEYYQYSMGGDK